MESPQESRRDVSSRNTGWAKKTAKHLAEANVSPNSVSVASMFFSLLSLAGFYAAENSSQPWLLLIAVLGIQGRLLCNLFDGMIAVEFHKKSNVGELYNEIPDRVSDALIILGAGIYSRQFGHAMDLAWAAVFLATFTAYIRVFGAALGVGHHFIGPMAKQHRMALITIATLLTAVTDIPMLYYSLPVMIIGLVITNVRRLFLISKLIQEKSR